jgi:[ribosomal protein S18]-alanine N-acetyltransferase
MLFTIRNSFEDSELALIYEIESECFGKEFRWTEPVFKREMLAARKKHLVWVACIGSRIAGYLIAEELSSSLSVDTCAVSRVHRRKGIASRLMAACEGAAKRQGHDQIRLEVFTDNPAQILYFQIGYRVCGFKRNYYGLKKHAVSMVKAL